MFSFQAGPGALIMATGIQDLNRTEFDRLNEIKGHLEIALLEKHFLRECQWAWAGRGGPVLQRRSRLGRPSLDPWWGQVWPRMGVRTRPLPAALTLRLPLHGAQPWCRRRPGGSGQSHRDGAKLPGKSHDRRDSDAVYSST